MIYLFFGQPCSGKTTLASKLTSRLNPLSTIHIDGDQFRAILGNNGYDRKSRLNNVKSAFDMAFFLEVKGYDVVLSFVTPYAESRYYLKDKYPATKFIYLEYNSNKTKRGRESYHVSDFEEPTFEESINDNFTSLNTSKLTENQCFDKLGFC